MRKDLIAKYLSLVKAYRYSERHSEEEKKYDRESGELEDDMTEEEMDLAVELYWREERSWRKLG